MVKIIHLKKLLWNWCEIFEAYIKLKCWFLSYDDWESKNVTWLFYSPWFGYCLHQLWDDSEHFNFFQFLCWIDLQLGVKVAETNIIERYFILKVQKCEQSQENALWTFWRFKNVPYFCCINSKLFFSYGIWRPWIGKYFLPCHHSQHYGKILRKCN